MAFGKTPTASFEAAGTESTVLDLGDNLPAGIKLPAEWTTASITFEACESSGGTFVPVYDGATGTAVTLSGAVASRWYAIAPQDLAGTPYVKLVSSVAQVEAVDVLVAMRRND